MEDPNQIEEMPSQSAPSMSLTGRLMNIYATPEDVFESIKPTRAAASNWLVPILLACAVGVINVWVMFSQPAIQQQLKQQQALKFEELVQDGKMTREQADQIQDQMGSTQIVFVKLAGSFGAVFFSFAWLFSLSLVLWLLSLWVFKTKFAYMKAVEMVGLTTMISVLGGIVTLLVILVKGNMHMTLSPALLIRNFDMENKLHLILASLNVITIWYVGVLCVGLSKLAGKSFAVVALWLYGGWAVLRVGIILSGLGRSGM